MSAYVQKHLVSDTLEHALTDHNHHSAIYKCSDNADQKDCSQHRQRRIQFCVIRILLTDQRNDKVVQQKLQRQ